MLPAVGTACVSVVAFTDCVRPGKVKKLSTNVWSWTIIAVLSGSNLTGTERRLPLAKNVPVKLGPIVSFTFVVLPEAV